MYPNAGGFIAIILSASFGGGTIIPSGAILTESSIDIDTESGSTLMVE